MRLFLILLWIPVSVLASDCDSLVTAFNNEAALECFQERLADDPENVDLQIATLRALIDTGEDAAGKAALPYFEEAVAGSEQFIESHPQSAEGYYYQAVALGRQAQFLGGKDKVSMAKEIRLNVDRALALDDQHAEAYLTRGIYFYELATLNKALRFFAKVLYGGLPEGGLDDAAADLEASLKLEPHNTNTLYHLALIAKRHKDYSACAHYCELALAQERTDHLDSQNQTLAKELMSDIAKKLKKQEARR
jgi:tetratricopeptide (TPR) repeat protein